MEVISYIVGSSVELDLLPKTASTRIRQLSDWLATVTGEDAQNATRAVVKRYRKNPIYRQNYRVESKTPGKRIPSQPWTHWLQQLGFQDLTVEHIRNLARTGQPKLVTEKELEMNA